MNIKLCIVENCGTKIAGRGYCWGHYNRWRKYGDPFSGGPLKRRVPKGMGWITSDGYREIVINGRKVREHRYVMEQILDRELLPGENVHHKNGVKTDNTPDNLELWASNQPSGQRVEDLADWAEKILRLYRPQSLTAEK